MESKIRTITTESGFTCEVNEDFIDDYEVLEAIADISEIETNGGKGLVGVKKLLELILGEDQKKKLIEHLKSIHGKAKTSDVEKEISEIIKEISSAKKN